MSNLVVQTNTLAINSHRNLKTVGGKLSTASARLSSGYKINSAADDASGLAISEKMRAQVRGLDMASKNTQDGISLIQTAEGGMQEIDNMLQRIRELTVQAANDTNDYQSSDRKKLQEEIDQLTQGIDAMAGQVEFNKKKLLDGSLTDAATKGSLLADISVKMQNAIGSDGIGSNFAAAGSDVSDLAGVVSTDGTLGIAFNNAAVDHSFAGSAVYTVTNTAAGTTGSVALTVFMSDYSGGGNALTDLDTSNFSDAKAVSDFIGAIDAYVGALQDAKKNNASGVEDELKSASIQRQAALDIYAGLELLSAQTKSYANLNQLEGSSLWFQTGSNSEQGIHVGIGKVTSDILGIGLGGGISTIKVDRADANEISSQIDVVDNALQYVTSQRAKLGAVQNRLDYTKASLEVSSENLTAAESRIRDTDMAKEMMKLTSANVLQQAGISMLSQANQAPQSVLSLLR